MRIGTLLAISLGLVACGDNTPGLTLGALESSRRAAECERYVRCGVFADAATCSAYFRKDIDPSLPAAVAAGKVQFDPLAAAACNDALAARSCDATTSEVRAVPEVCKAVLVGTIAAGATCLDDRECGTGRCDAPACAPDACCPGGCAPFVAPAKLDAACTPEIGCVDGAFCGADKSCHALVVAGGDCDADAHCAAGLACIGPTDLQAGTCRALPRLGESCPYQRCAEIGARCDASQHCVPIGTDGATCTDDAECSEFYECDPASHRCTDQPGLGQPCTGRCAGEAYCDFSSGSTGVCHPPQPSAAPCLSDDQCASEYCAEGPIFDQCTPQAVCF